MARRVVDGAHQLQRRIREAEAHVDHARAVIDRVIDCAHDGRRRRGAACVERLQRQNRCGRRHQVHEPRDHRPVPEGLRKRDALEDRGGRLLENGGGRLIEDDDLILFENGGGGLFQDRGRGLLEIGEVRRRALLLPREVVSRRHAAVQDRMRRVDARVDDGDRARAGELRLRLRQMNQRRAWLRRVVARRKGAEEGRERARGDAVDNALERRRDIAAGELRHDERAIELAREDVRIGVHLEVHRFGRHARGTGDEHDTFGVRRPRRAEVVNTHHGGHAVAADHVVDDGRLCSYEKPRGRRHAGGRHVGRCPRTGHRIDGRRRRRIRRVSCGGRGGRRRCRRRAAVG